MSQLAIREATEIYKSASLSKTVKGGDSSFKIMIHVPSTADNFFVRGYNLYSDAKSTYIFEGSYLRFIINNRST